MRLLQAVGHHAANLHVNVIPQHSRLGNVKNVVVTCLHDAVYLQLSLREFPVNGEGASVVRAIVLGILGTGITQRQSSAFKHIIRWGAVHYLAMLCEDGGETHLLAQRMGNAVHLSADVFLRESWLSESHRRGVHLITYGACLLNLCYLERGLHLAHLNDSHDKLYRSGFLLL